MAYRMNFRPPPGVAIQQTSDGMLLIHYEAEMIPPLREALDVLRAELLDHALKITQAEKELELQRQALPQDRISVLNAEIARLEQQREAPQKVMATK